LKENVEGQFFFFSIWASFVRAICEISEKNYLKLAHVGMKVKVKPKITPQLSCDFGS